MSGTDSDRPEEHTPSGPSGADETERLRETCPVRPEHKAVFPASPWRWQPGAASWVWAVLKETGGKAQGSELTGRLAEVRGWPRRKANNLRNQGLFVLEAFGLVEIERPGGSGPKSAYGRIEIVREEIAESEGGDEADRAAETAGLRMFLAAVVQDLPGELADQVRARFGATLTRGESGDTVCLELTPEQRALLADPAIFFLDPDLNDEVERERRDRDGLRFTLEQLDRFCGYIAAHANHAEDAQTEDVLDEIFEEIRFLQSMHNPDGP